MGSVLIEVVDADQRNVHIRDIAVLWEEETGSIPGASSVTFAGMEHGPPGAPIEIWIQGRDMGQMLAASEDLMEKLKSFDGVRQVHSDYRPGKNELRLKLKPEARALGLTVEDLGRQARAGYYGDEVLRLQRGRDDIRVKVRYTSEERSRASDLDTIRIRTPQGHEIPLLSVADISYGPGYSNISRTDGWRRIQVSADIDPKRANATEVIAKLRGSSNSGKALGDSADTSLSMSFFAQLEDTHRGVNISVQGEQNNTRESLGSLLVGFPLALLGIYVIIATIFRSYAQPFVIMATVPFGIIGAIWGHLFMGIEVTMMSVFGIVALSGVVVNDAIVLIECLNNLVSEGVPYYEAIRRAGARRFRAIFLTTISTCGGLAPIILETDFQAQFLIPMALSLAAGVAFATLLTLLLIPCLLGILNDMRRAAHAARYGQWPAPEAVEPACGRKSHARGHQPALEPQVVK